MGQLIWISGPPASGKSSLARRLIQEFQFGIVIPVDDIREWVHSGYAGPVPWTDTTEEQYRLGEEAACAVALQYMKADFSVIIDACRNPVRVNELLIAMLPAYTATKVLLLPTLEENLRRAQTRTNKDFDPHFLDNVIANTHAYYGKSASPEWIQLDNTHLTLDEETRFVISKI